MHFFKLSVQMKNTYIIMKDYFKIVYMIVAILCSYITLRVLSGQVTESIRILCYILCGYAIKKSDCAMKDIALVFDSFQKKILLLLLEFYAVFSITGLYFLPVSLEYEKQYSFWIYFALSFCWIRPVIQFLLSLILKTGKFIHVRGCKVTFKRRFILTASTIIPGIIFLYAFNPAITSTDSEEILAVAYRLWMPDLNVDIIDWHPPFYFFVLNLFHQICPSVSFVIVIQYVCFALIFTDAVIFLFQFGCSAKILGGCYFFIAFGITNILQLISLWKDIPYMISIMWLTLLLMKLVIQHDIYTHKKGWYFQFVLAVTFTALFRQNGILPALTIVILLPILTKGSKKFLITSMICLLFVIGIKKTLYEAMDVIPQPQLKFFSLSNDIMYSYYYGENALSEETMELINKITKNSPDSFEYNPYWVAYNKDEPSGYSVAEFMKIYVRNFIENPQLTVSAIASRSSTIWSIVKPMDEPVRNVNAVSEKHSFAPLTYPFRTYNMLTYVLTDISDWLCTNSIYYIFCWRIGIYVLLLFGLVVIILCLQKGNKLWYLIPFMPILMNLLSLFGFSGWTDYRYYWPVMPISLLLLFYFWSVCSINCIHELKHDKAEKNMLIYEIHTKVFMCFALISLIFTLVQEIHDYQISFMQRMSGDNCLESYLHMLISKDKNAIIEISDLDIWKSSAYKNILQMGGYDLSCLTDDTDCIILYKGDCVESLEGFLENANGHDTRIGKLQSCMEKDGKHSVYLDDRELYFVSSDLRKAGNIIISVLDDECKNVIDFAFANYIVEDEADSQKKLTHLYHMNISDEYFNELGGG